MKLLRSIMAVVVGFVAASVIMMAVETVNGHVRYLELGKQAADVKDREAIRGRGIMAAAPVGALLVVILGWALGSLADVGADRARIGHALILGGLLLLAGIANNLMVPPPLWFWCAGLIVFLPAAYAGARLAPRGGR